MDKVNKDGGGVMFLETEKEWLSLGECAQFLGVTKTTILRWAKLEEVNFPEPKRMSTRKTFYSAALVRDWFENQEGNK